MKSNQLQKKKKLFGIDLINFGKNNIKIEAQKKNGEKGGSKATIGKAFRRKLDRLGLKKIYLRKL